MRFLFWRGMLCLTTVLPVSYSFAQQKDTIRTRQLQEVEVVEQSRPAVNRASVPVQAISKEMIDRMGMQNLSEAVKRFSGVTVKDYGGIGGLKTVSIRSFGAQHTAVSYDGITISDAQSGQVDISRFSLDNVEEITLTIGQSDEIFQTARMYASVGVLAIKTNRPVFQDKPFHIRSKIGGGSFGLLTPSFQYDRKLTDHFSLTTRADWVSAKGEYPFTLINGQLVTKEKRKNSDVQSLRLESNLYGSLGGGEFNAKIYYYDSERGLPGSVTYYNDYAKERLWDNHFFSQAYYRKDWDVLSFQSSVRYNYSYSKYRNVDSMFPDGMQEDRNTQQEYYFSTGVHYRPLNGFSTSLTSDLSYTTLDNNFENKILPERLTSLTALAMQYQTSRLTLTGSLLATYMRDEVRSGDRPADKKRLSPALGVSWRPFSESSFRLRASFKDIFRVPTFTDLYYQRIGNTNLNPERALQYNLGLTWSGENSFFRYLSVSADVYYNKAEDKIVAVPTMYVWKMRNLGEVETIGLDFNLHLEKLLTSGMAVLFSSTYSYMKAVDVTDTGSKVYHHQIQYAPKHSGTTSVSLENPWVNLSYQVTAVGKRYSLPQNIKSNEITGYVEHNLSLNRSFPIGRANLRVQAELLNLTNKTYDIIRFYPMPGRSWRLSLVLIY
ncbi:MAG: TonB-dependent receptor [Massilibacteroides sp.]|nr:TonB-dependent receptor [Massilibacteroides sp.]MDD3063036.1 TonB-dependent receptor [Massilibacteroides sp.]MDD4660545.1 TonB-dependent receptor [Massilibacteroides sp.]